jgi:hypothetical protein
MIWVPHHTQAGYLPWAWGCLKVWFHRVRQQKLSEGA